MRALPATGTVLIEGHGVAALCCAQLLFHANVPYLFRRSVAQEQPALLLGSQAAELVRDVCGVDVRDGRGWRIERRVVLWGDTEAPLTVAHHATAVGGDVLVETLLNGLPCAAEESEDDVAWTLRTKSVPGDNFHAYGNRRAVTLRAKLRAGVDARSCWIESTADGWMFLLPYGEHEASLICTGTDAEKVLLQSRLVMRQVDHISSASPEVSIAPRLAQQLAAPGLLIAGSAAMRFDPLCGEGVGHAVREAYLAVAVARAALGGEPPEELIAHYSGRLRRAFLRHLQVCSTFYRSGGVTAFWKDEDAALQCGITTMNSMIERQEPPRFAFRESSLTTIGPSVSVAP